MDRSSQIGGPANLARLLLFISFVIFGASALAQGQRSNFFGNRTSQRLSHSFEEARLEFLSLANQRKQVQVKDLRLSEKRISYPGERLSIDAAYAPALNSHNRRLVVLISGQHGAEAPAGSAIQRDFLDSCQWSDPEVRRKTGFLLIHGMNPFGYKYGRRFNQNNVDLNRNFFDFQTQNGSQFPGKNLYNDTYEKLKHLFQSPMYYIHEITRGIEAIATVLRSGGKLRDLIEAFGGQYQDPKGLYYGGSQVEAESKAVQEILNETIPRYAEILVINIHTGIGDYGMNNLITTAPEAMNGSPSPESEEAKSAYHRELAMLEKLFPKGACRGKCQFYSTSLAKGQKAFALPGTMTRWLYEKFHKQRAEGLLIPVVAEIGTHWGPVMLPKVVNENFCFVNPDKCSASVKVRRTQRLKEAFNPPASSWTTSVGHISKGICEAALKFSSP